MAAEPPSKPSLAALVAEFVPLNRRRLHGDPPLGVQEFERWSVLRDLLEYRFGHPAAGRPGLAERALRVPTHLKVRYGGDAEEVASSRNLSEGGLFVETTRPVARGTPLRLAIDPGDGSDPIAVDATVVWSRELATRDGPAGFGVAFRDLEAEEYAALGRLVERRLQQLAQQS